MATAADKLSRSKEVSNMIKQGFISDPSLSVSPSRPTPTRVSPQTPSPPPYFSSDKLVRSSPTLIEMMTDDHHRESRLLEDRRRKSQERVSKILADSPFSDPNLGRLSDVKLTISSKDGMKVPMDVHRSVLVEQSRFFAEKLKQDEGVVHDVEICDCDDVEVYVETVVLMYCDDLKRRLWKEDVATVLGLLKVSSAIMFDIGIMSCLEYLEAVPWSVDEEEKVVSVLDQLQLHDSATNVLQRVSAEPSTSNSGNEIFLRLLGGVLQAKDDKARREMKILISGLLREDTTKNRNHADSIDISGEILYQLCDRCVSSLIQCLSETESMEEGRRDQGVLKGEIGREADNLQWIVDIMIEKKLAEEFVKLWANQKELFRLHSRIPVMYRYEISKVTAQLCIAIGRGQILVPRDTRFSLLCTWLDALYEDFGWMKRACRSLDKNLVEDGIGQTILTLSLGQQQVILLNWFNCFLNKGDDCPNIQRAFEVWWRRSFVRQYVADKDLNNLQITVCDYPT